MAAVAAGLEDALGLLASLVFGQKLAGLDVVDAGGRVLLVRDDEPAPIGMQIEGLGRGHAADAPQQGVGGRVVNRDGVVVGATDEELRAVGAEQDPAGSGAGLDRCR